MFMYGEALPGLEDEEQELCMLTHGTFVCGVVP